MSIRLIRPDGTKTHAVFLDQDAALKAAARAVKRLRVPLHIVWCRPDGNPKLWLARVAADGTVTKTAFWGATDPLSRYRDARWLAVARRKQVTSINAGRLSMSEHRAEAMVTMMVQARDAAIQARHDLYRPEGR